MIRRGSSYLLLCLEHTESMVLDMKNNTTLNGPNEYELGRFHLGA